MPQECGVEKSICAIVPDMLDFVRLAIETAY
jgi:hypothetical protein